MIERAAIFTEGMQLELGDWLRKLEAATPIIATPNKLDPVERAHILAVLEHTGWRVSGPQGAAERLGMPRTTLESRMQKLGIVRT